MSTNEAGTPVDGTAGTGDGGTAGAGAEGSGGRSPSIEDLKALEQAHRKNLEKERQARQEAEQRIAELERRAMSAYAPPVDPQMQRIHELQQRAPFDDNAAAILDLTTQTTVQALENKLLADIIAMGIPREMVPSVQGFVRQSQYQMSVAQAARYARGEQVDSIESERAKLAEENKRLQKELEAAKTRVPNMAMSPAVAVSSTDTSIPASRYNAILANGGAQAQELMARTKLPRGSAGYLNIDYNE